MLEQVNSRRGEQWKAWQDERFTSRDIPPHEAAKSILTHYGEEAFEKFHMAVFRAYHVDKRDISSQLELLNIAESVGIETDLVSEDLRTRKFKEVVGADHEAADEQDIFGVPTVLFDGEQPTFFKLAEGEWEGTDEDLSLFHSIVDVAAPRPYVMEIKKPASASSAAVSAARRARENG